jgi:hypothetical protein
MLTYSVYAPLSNRIGALPLNLTCGVETTLQVSFLESRKNLDIEKKEKLYYTGS